MHYMTYCSLDEAEEASKHAHVDFEEAWPVQHRGNGKA
jgi:hypothetical protein